MPNAPAIRARQKRVLEDLGMAFGTANARLRKALMFQLVHQAGRGECFRCGKLIETAVELSIEHKVGWEKSEDPAGLFFALENISFSHLMCNIAAGKRPKKIYESREQQEAARLRRRYLKHKPQIMAKRRARRWRKRIGDPGPPLL